MSQIDFRPAFKGDVPERTNPHFHRDLPAEDIAHAERTTDTEATRSVNRSTLIAVVIALTGIGGLISALALFNSAPWNTTVRSWPREIFRHDPAEIESNVVAHSLQAAPATRIGDAAAAPSTGSTAVAAAPHVGSDHASPPAIGSPLSQPVAAKTAPTGVVPANVAVPPVSAQPAAPIVSAANATQRAAAEAPHEVHVIVDHKVAKAAAAARKTTRSANDAKSVAVVSPTAGNALRNERSAVASTNEVPAARSVLPTSATRSLSLSVQASTQHHNVQSLGKGVSSAAALSLGRR